MEQKDEEVFCQEEIDLLPSDKLNTPSSESEVNIANVEKDTQPDHRVKNKPSGKKVPSKSECKCEICGKTFSQNITLKGHIKSIHQKIKDEKCDICGKIFALKRSLWKHQTFNS